MNEGYSNKNDVNDHHEEHGENSVANDAHPDYATVADAEYAQLNVEHTNREEGHDH